MERYDTGHAPNRNGEHGGVRVPDEYLWVASDQFEVEFGQEVGRVIASNRRQYNANVGIKEHFVKIGRPILSRIRDEAAPVQRAASDLHLEAELANLRNASL